MTESHIIQHSSTTTSTTTNAIASEREEVMTECIHGTMQPIVFLDNTTVDHKSISLHHTSDKSTAMKSSTTATVSCVSLPIMIALPDDPTKKKMIVLPQSYLLS